MFLSKAILIKHGAFFTILFFHESLEINLLFNKISVYIKQLRKTNISIPFCHLLC